MRSRYVIGIVAAGTLLTACEGLKEALTAHVDVVARAGSQELSVNRLGDLLGGAKIQVPVSRETAAILADIWTGYQQLAFAAAHGDSLNDKKAIDAAVAPIVNVQKLSHFMDSVQKTFKVDSGSEAAYNQAAGGLLAARHILIGFKNPGVPASAAEKDSVRKKAEQVRAQVTAANFTEMAKKLSTDPSAAAEWRQPRRLRPWRYDRGVPDRDGRAQARRDLAARRDQLRLSHHSAFAVRRSEERFRRRATRRPRCGSPTARTWPSSRRPATSRSRTTRRLR